MMQGDAYSIPIEVKSVNGIITDKDIEDLEVLVGIVRKTFKERTLFYDKDLKKFIFPFSQEDTFRLKGKRQPAQIRVKLKSGEVIGIKLEDFIIDFSQSQEVL